MTMGNTLPDGRHSAMAKRRTRGRNFSTDNDAELKRG